MKKFIALLFTTAAIASERPIPQVIYTTHRHINVITLDEVNKVYAEVSATVIPGMNVMRINLKLYLNDLLIGEQNNEVSW